MTCEHSQELTRGRTLLRTAFSMGVADIVDKNLLEPVATARSIEGLKDQRRTVFPSSELIPNLPRNVYLVLVKQMRSQKSLLMGAFFLFKSRQRFPSRNAEFLATSPSRPALLGATVSGLHPVEAEPWIADVLRVRCLYV